MRDAHLTAAEFEGLLQDENEVRNRLILHHLATCPACYDAAGYILDLYLSGEVDISLGSIDIALGRSRRGTQALWEQLSRYPFERQLALVRDTERFRNWGLCEFLCAESEREASRDPRRARQLAELAVEISSHIDEWEVAEPHWQHELRAYALAHLANALRVLGDLREAGSTFLAADRLWEPAVKDVGDVLDYEARYLAFKASLRRAERRLPEALTLLDQALAANPSPELRVRILISQAKAFEEQGRIIEALELIEQARLEEIAESDVRIGLCLAQNHLDYLSKAGRTIEAQASLPEVEALVDKLGGIGDQLRFRWTRARIAKGLGRSAEALQELEGVREGFAREGLRYDAALSSLELSLMYVQLQRMPEALPVIRDTLTILAALDVQREGLMAVRVLTQAIEEGQVTVELIAEVLESLRRGTGSN